MTKPADIGASRLAATIGTLNKALAVYRAQSKQRRPEFAVAYDELVSRLTAVYRQEIGPAAGQPMPSFLLPDQSGRLIALEALLQNGPVVISFNRGHWCPYCKLDLQALANAHSQVTKLGASIVSIMPETAKFTKNSIATNELPFPVLSDIDLGYSLSLGMVFWVGTEVRKLYEAIGIDLAKFQGNEGYFLPMAAKFVIGQDGLVKARHVNVEFRERVEPDALIETLKRL